MKTISERILRPATDKNGYLYVDLYKDGKRKTYKVHRLVAQAFIPNPHSLPEVNHKNEDKTDNRVENLEWCTQEYNINYGTRNVKVAKSMSKPVLQYTVDGELVREWKSTAEAEQQVGFSHQNISSCCLGKAKTYKGYIWKYKETA